VKDIERVKNKEGEAMREWDGWAGEKQQDSLSQRKGKAETLNKTNPLGTESHPSIKCRLSKYFFPELNSLMELKKTCNKTNFQGR